MLLAWLPGDDEKLPFIQTHIRHRVLTSLCEILTCTHGTSGSYLSLFTEGDIGLQSTYHQDQMNQMTPGSQGTNVPRDYDGQDG